MDMGWLATVAPTIATALAGPLAGAAVSFLAGKFGTEKTVEAVQSALSGMTGEQLVKLKEMELEFQKAMAENGIKIDLAQIEVNKLEASNASIFVSGWRPAIGWVCGIAFGYAAVLEPLARFIAQVGFGYVGLFPVIDTMLTLQVLGGLLGLAGLRSWDKKNGAA